MAKRRTPIPQSTAAEALFLADRTCCVCRENGKPVQLHHIDEDPSNNDLSNLAALCLDCHHQTQLTGGFARRLDSEQVLLYRDDWNRMVAGRRAPRDRSELPKQQGDDGQRVKLTTSIAEAYRENEEWVLLAMLYDSVGNESLRDKYIETAISEGTDDDGVIFLRGLQGRPDLIPEDVANREIESRTQQEDWTQRARVFMNLGRYRDAAEDYVRGVLQSFEEGRTFSAAFYLRELVDNDLIASLFVEALQDAADRGDLWWQVRALQELGWDKELKALLLENAEEIEQSSHLMLQGMLSDARGESDQALTKRIETFSSAKRVGRKGT